MFPLRPTDVQSGDLVMVESVLVRTRARSSYIASFEAKSIALLAPGSRRVVVADSLEPDLSSLWIL